MTKSPMIPTWRVLFGALDVKEADAGRSVYSPAAYLADLLQLLEDRFEAADLQAFDERRPDIRRDILLNGESAFKSVPHLEITNRILAARIAAQNPGESAESVLATARRPLALPFEVDHERARELLRLLKVDARDLYAAFTRELDEDTLARERLGLSPARAAAVLEDLGGRPDALQAVFGAKPEDLADLEAFRRATGVDAPTLRALLFARLSPTALDAGGRPERGAADQLFLNRGLGGYVALDAAEEKLVWVGQAQAIPHAWFDRVGRLLRLARWTGVDLVTLDLVLRTLCDGTLDARALRCLAGLVDLGERTGVAVEVLACLLGELDGAAALGASDTPEAASLFDRVFNGEAAGVARRYIPSGCAYVPERHAAWDRLEATGDLLADAGRNPELRGRVARGLGLASADLKAVVGRFIERADARKRTSILAGAIGPRGLSTLHRVARLAEMTELPPMALLRLVDVLERDPSLDRINAFAVVHHDVAPWTDLYAILEAGSPDARAWLIGHVVAVAAWAAAAGLSPDDLAAVALAPDMTAADELAWLLELTRQVHDAFVPTALTADQLASADIPARSARVALATLRELNRGLVAPSDARLVTWDDAAATAAAHAVLARLDVVTIEDIAELELGEALAEYLHTTLIRRGILDDAGLLRVDRLPARPEDLELEPDLGDRAGAVHDFLAGLYQQSVDDEVAAEDRELALYHSDLLGLGFTTEEADELIERLVLLGVIDELGAVVDPERFADPDARDSLPLDVGLAQWRDRIHGHLVDVAARWARLPLPLPEDLWDGLKLTVAERDALAQNLVYNGHLDAAGRVADREALLAHTPASFDLELPLYRHRRAILAALQGFVRATRDIMLRVQSEQLRPLADHIVAGQVLQALAAEHLDADGRPNAGLRELLTAELPAIDLGPSLTVAQHDRIWAQLRGIRDDADAFRLTDAALASIDITGRHVDEVLERLRAAGHLRPDRTLPPERVPWFAEIDSALRFVVPEFEDYARDIFFLLHDVANAVDRRVQSLTAALAGVAAAQTDAVLAALAGAMEVSPAGVAAILRPILGNTARPTVALMTHVLAAADPDGAIAAAPRGWRFVTAVRRVRQLASYTRKLAMDPAEIDVIVDDQQLGDKLPEPLALPDGVTVIDALWTGPDGQIYLFSGPRYWTFDATTLASDGVARPLSELSPELAGVAAVDAVYTTPRGDHWLLAAGRTLRRAAVSNTWVPTPRVWGRVHSGFVDPAHIDAALHDHEGRLHLFAGDQYVRYTQPSQALVDEGYPRRIDPRWQEELGFGPLPSGWSAGIDAGVRHGDDLTWLFRGDRFVASTEPGVELPIVDAFGRVRHQLAAASRVDAVFDLGGRCCLVVGDQATLLGGALEAPDLVADEGYPRSLAALLPGLPEAFSHGVDAGLTAPDGTLYLFRDQSHARRVNGVWTTHATRERWGVVRNNIQRTGAVDAALGGLDGKIYLFSGDQVYRYSGQDLSRVDEGYPRSIAREWGGLDLVDAAFVLDGRTYLFGRTPAGPVYFRYSGRDHTVPDEGYPRATDDNFWNLPQSLIDRGFSTPDAVFVDPEGHAHLFSGPDVITFDHNHRWWSEPRKIAEVWNSLPFSAVSAAFTARDGKSYVFSAGPDSAFMRYSDRTLQRPDDRFPRPTREHWGRFVNQLERTGRVDAAVSVDSTAVTVDPKGVQTRTTTRHHYLFSGDQLYRYSNLQSPYVDEGYPVRIQGGLVREPAFVHLKAPVDRGIDGVWADAGNVHVFVSDQVHVASTAHLRELPDLGVPAPRAADVDEGRILLQGAGGWRRVLTPEGRTRDPRPVAPRALRGAPAAFQGPLACVLRGLDRNVYLFTRDRCHDRSLARDYPTGLTWGRVRNHIAADERVDAALMGRDGKLVLFRSDQYVTYTPDPATPNRIPALAAASPAPIAPRWGGLDSVVHAFVRGDVTYLLEAPQDDGTFRYVRYSGVDLARPDDPEPQTGDFSFWEIPEKIVAAGFDRVDAVFTEDRDLFLVRDRQFVHYEAATDTWTHPRPLAVRWPGLPTRHPDFEAILAIFRGPDDLVYFFSHGAWVSHDGQRSSEPAAIAGRWALLDHRIVRANRVDAALVHGEHTFLFSGDQYVRYTGPDYEYVDGGYPRPIAGELRREAPFAHLPDDLERRFAALKPDDVWIESALHAGGVVFVQAAGRAYAISPALSRSYPLARLAALRNELQRRARVDAAFTGPGDAMVLLSGDQFVRYSGADLEFVDDGYPRAIGDDLLRELGAAAILPTDFTHDIDAACFVDGALVLFKGRQFVRVPANSPVGFVISPRPVKDAWGRAANPFAPDNGQSGPRLDAAFVATDGALYVFKDSQYLRYADPAADLADEGFPRKIRDDWGDLPDAFESGIDGAFVFDDRTYLCRGDRYVRYSDPTRARIDPIYPQTFVRRWGLANDFLLHDLRLAERYISLCRAHPSADASLTTFMSAAPRDKADPYALLAELFGWDGADLRWLKRMDGFLRRPAREAAAEVRFDLELVLRIHDTMALAARLGASPRELYAQVWTPLHGPAATRDVARAVDTLTRLLATLYPGDNWRKISRQLGDASDGAFRDAAVAWLLAHDRAAPADARDLSSLLLTDVEMAACNDTSPIVEAIAAVQLYFHRYLLDLESLDPVGDEDAVRRAAFKEQWRWLKNYRVWEANRKVFLYPETYIRPELRDTATPAFATLQDDLLQGDITDASVTQAYKKYLDEYTQVSRLTIAGGYVQPDPRDPTDQELTLFGCTRTSPRRYYYRTATFLGGDTGAAVWRAWRPLGIEINAERVYPVRAFGRTFVFWAEVERTSPDAASASIQTTDKGSGVSEVRSNAPVEYRLKVSYSFYDLNEQWASPQLLRADVVALAPISDARLRVDASNESDGQDYIAIGCHYAAGGQPGYRALRLTADLELSGSGRPASADGRISMLQTLFVGEAPDLARVVELSSAIESIEAPWYSFDLKGGSFLARPAVDPLPPAQRTLQPLATLAAGMSAWATVDAGLAASDGRSYLFNNQRATYRTRVDATEQPIGARWGLVRTRVHEDGRVDAAWRRGDALFLARGGAYLKYSQGDRFADESGEVALQAAQADPVPRWPGIDAAFTDARNVTWFFRGAQMTTSQDLASTAAINTRWGIEDNELTGGRSGVIAAFSRGDRTWLVGATTFVAYAGGQVALCDSPRPQSLRALLGELGCSNPQAVPDGLLVEAVIDRGADLALRAGGQWFGLTGDKVAALADNAAPAAGRVAGFVRDDNAYELSADGKLYRRGLSGGPVNAQQLARPIAAAVMAGDGRLYLFSGREFVGLDAGAVSLAGVEAAVAGWSARPIASAWGRVRNRISEGGPIDAALRRGEQLFLVSGDRYHRYSNTDLACVDPGYPRPLAGNPDGLPEAGFDAAVELADGSVCFFVGDAYVTGASLGDRRDLRARWGRVRTNILTRGVDCAFRDGPRHYLLSGDEIARYTATADGKLPLYMDGPPIHLRVARFGPVVGAFRYLDHVYLIGEDSFVCCRAGAPEEPLSGYPRAGRLTELHADLRARYGLAAGGGGFFALDNAAARGVMLHGSRLYVGYRSFFAMRFAWVLDLASGATFSLFEGMPTPDPLDWNRLFGGGDVFVDTDAGRYTFRGDRYTRTAAGVPAKDPWTPADDPVPEVWGLCPVDAAIVTPDGLDVHLFTGDRFHRVALAELSGLFAGRSSLALENGTPILGSWGNLPQELIQGLGGSMQEGDALYLFKGDRYVKFDGARRPFESATIGYQLIRLTTSTAAELNRRLFAGGVPGLLSLDTQEVDETPGFSDEISNPTTIRLNPNRVQSRPISGHLDYGSANGIYYWEVFFHAPFLIAETLNTAQRFKEARQWYEHIFDPTEPADVWKFLPFLGVDVEQIVARTRDRLARGGWADSPAAAALAPRCAALLGMDRAFQGERDLGDAERAALAAMRKLDDARQAVKALATTAQTAPLRDDLLETIGMIEGLADRWDEMNRSRPAQIEAYLEDPFDPHAIAALRPIAYRKAIVMRYLDNLLDWGDMLFGQYTRESINEARMLYVHAWDLLGRRPESLGRRVLTPDRPYADLRDADEGADDYDLLLRLEDQVTAAAKLGFSGAALPTPNDTVARPYFFIPANSELEDYWTRVEDRLHKIRQGLNILGVRQPLALFEPPLDPMALVRAVAAGGGFASVDTGAGGVVVPHYRFSFLIAKAQALAAKVSALGSELLSTLERRDAEELSRLQNRQEGVILTMTREVRVSQLREATENKLSLEQALANAQKRIDEYSEWIADDYLPLEVAQLSLMSGAALAHMISAVANVVAAATAPVPEVTIGVFSTGAETGGNKMHAVATSIGTVSQSAGEALQVTGEILGITAQHQRMMQEWTLQRELAKIDKLQIQAQIRGAEAAIAGARQELAIAERQIEHNESVSRYFREKFTNKELYEWMAGRLSGIHYQTYQLALGMARAAERAFQFEHGRREADTTFIQGTYWDSQRKGLTAGDALVLDLDRMESAFIAADERSLEISKSISLIELDPLAFLALKAEGACEFDFTEALFDYDFPGHYCRQVKTIAVKLDCGEGVFVNATLTQLTNRVVTEPDPKAVAFLLDPKESPPASIRHDWRAVQQIALSHYDEYDKPNGLFELRFDNDRYLPFEGTGAVSRWRLELGGGPGSRDLRRLVDVSITLKYTATSGGAPFAAAVRGLLKPVDRLRCFDLVYDFGEQWTAFVEGDSPTLELPLAPHLFPDMASGRIRAVFTRYETTTPGAASFSLDLGGPVPLPDGKTVETSGLTVRSAGTTLTLTLKGDRTALRNAYLVMSYKAGVR